MPRDKDLRRPLRQRIRPCAKYLSDSKMNQRFKLFLAEQAKAGFTQDVIARRLGVGPQYISDCKAGRRSITELFARRLADEFQYPFKWFLEGPRKAGCATKETVAAVEGEIISLSLYSRPICGAPDQDDAVEATITLTGTAAALASQCDSPYALRVKYDDRQGRLKRDDVVLVNQSDDLQADICIIEANAHRILARSRGIGGWEPLPKRWPVMSDVKVIGFCVGIIWAEL